MEQFSLKSLVEDKPKRSPSPPTFSDDKDRTYLARVVPMVIIATFSIEVLYGIVILLTAEQKLNAAIAVVATITLLILNLVLIFVPLTSAHRKVLAALSGEREQLALHQIVEQLLGESEVRFRLI